MNINGHFHILWGLYYRSFMRVRAELFVMQEFILSQKKCVGDPEKPLVAELTYTNILKVIQEFIRTGILPDLVKPFFVDGAFPVIDYRLNLNNFYHPHVCFLIKTFYKSAIEDRTTKP